MTCRDMRHVEQEVGAYHVYRFRYVYIYIYIYTHTHTCTNYDFGALLWDSIPRCRAVPVESQ